MDRLTHVFWAVVLIVSGLALFGFMADDISKAHEETLIKSQGGGNGNQGTSANFDEIQDTRVAGYIVAAVLKGLAATGALVLGGLAWSQSPALVSDDAFHLRR